MTHRVLIIEDDFAIRQGLEMALLKRGYEVRTAPDAEEGEEVLDEFGPHIVVLDLMLPGRSGLELCKRLRSNGTDTPILMLTARSDESDRVLGLDLGADDYVTKPFSLDELEARIRALIRRSAPGEPDIEELKLGAARIDFKQYRAWKDDEEVHLPPKAFGLLKHLAMQRGEVVSRDALLEAVWGFDAMPTTRTVDTHIAQVRAAIEDDPANPVWVRTVHGVGYILNREA
jgi:DNA-binding response OmpR family regulator